MEPHGVVFWLCTWGVNFARLVWPYWQFSALLKWPQTNTPRIVGDSGISWVDLAISFMVAVYL